MNFAVSHILFDFVVYFLARASTRRQCRRGWRWVGLLLTLISAVEVVGFGGWLVLGFIKAVRRVVGWAF
jgi:hypothetical protein